MNRTPAWLYGAEGLADLNEAEAEELSALKNTLRSRVQRVVFWLILIGTITFVVGSAVAQQTPPMPPNGDVPRCASRNDLVKGLERKYSESVVGFGVMLGGGLLEVLSSVEKNTWTIIVVRPDGWACITAAGEGWENLPIKLPEEPA